MKKIAMIPARLGSKRVKNKNLRLINGKPLIAYIVEAAKAADCFDEIYINSEALIFKHIADQYGIGFYQRPDHLSSDTATNDDFALDFINAKKPDILFQLLATSPFVTPEQIRDFVQAMQTQEVETLVSVKKEQIECIYDGKPINFELLKQTPPSQLLKPVLPYACVLMGWDTNRYRQNIERFGAGYHGGDGTIGYFTLDGYATIDIDREEDFALAEVVAQAIKTPKTEPEYYDPEKKQLIFDADRQQILTEDGVVKNVMNDYNKEISDIQAIIDSYPTTSSWSHTLINSPSNCATLIAQLPGEGNRLHHHPDWDEWWYILDGTWEWWIDGQGRQVKKGDVIFIERNRRHKITAIGDKRAIRLAVSRADVDHVYEEQDYVPNKVPA